MNWKCFWIGHHWQYSDFKDFVELNTNRFIKKEPMMKKCTRCNKIIKRVQNNNRFCGYDEYEVEE